MIGLGIFILCLHTVMVSSQRTASIIGATPDKEESLGGNVELSCSVENMSINNMIWSKIDKDRKRKPVTIFAGEKKFIFDDRFSLREDPKNGIYTLEIKNVNYTDAGYYICSITIDSDNEVSKEIRLQIKYRPVIVNSTTTPVILSSNKTGKLDCYVSGYPSPRVTWTRENGAPLPTGGIEFEGFSLKISNASRAYAGTYYCIADNQVGSPVRKQFNVMVEYAPEVEILRPRVGQALKFNASLECRVSAAPTPTIVWMKDGARVLENQHIRISQNATIDDYTVSKLSITSVERSQYGKYTCEARNNLGVRKGTVEFYETENEQCVPTCGSNLDLPDFKLLLSTSLVMTVVFIRW